MPASPHERLLCLDIETVPDRNLIPDDWPADKFPKPLWHRVVAISFVEARLEQDRSNGRERAIVTECGSVGETGWSERELLQGFWAAFAKSPARVVGWHTRGFDIPILSLRTMIHELPAAAWHQSGTKWESYTQRYASDWHADLCEIMADFGACARMGLDETARAMGLPGKVGGHGSEVEAMVGRGELEQVRAYCEADCLNLFGLYARYARLTGRMDRSGFKASIESLTTYLDLERIRRPALGEFLDRWQGAADPAPVLAAVPA